MPGYRDWTRVACWALIGATFYALAVVALRIPGIAAPPDAFRMALALHVELAVFVWLTSSMAGQWMRGVSGATPRIAPRLALAATALIALTPLGGGTPIMADYFPWISGNMLFTVGFALFCAAILGAAAAAIHAAPTHARTLSAWALLAGALTLLGDLINGARDLHTLVWGAGHVLLFSHIAMMLWEWSTLSGRGHRIARAGGIWLALIAILLVIVPWVLAPGSAEHRRIFTESMRWLLWPPAVALLAVLFWSGLRERRRPSTGVLISMLLLPVGLLLGMLIDAQTTLITAHYHAAIGAVAVSRMSMTYFLHAHDGHSVVRRHRSGQLATYGSGIALLVAGLLIASMEDAPRKTAASERATHGPAYTFGMSVSGAGGLLAMLGTLWLVGNLWRRNATVQGEAVHGREENRRAKCHAIATTASTAAARSQGVVQS